MRIAVIGQAHFCAEVIRWPSLGTIQYHPSLLPRHRGGSAISWAIIQGEDKTGLTIFSPDKGIDTGPILLQKEVEIDPSVRLIKEGKAPRILQDESKVAYEGLCIEGVSPEPGVIMEVRGDSFVGGACLAPSPA